MKRLLTIAGMGLMLLGTAIAGTLTGDASSVAQNDHGAALMSKAMVQVTVQGAQTAIEQAKGVQMDVAAAVIAGKATFPVTKGMVGAMTAGLANKAQLEVDTAAYVDTVQANIGMTAVANDLQISRTNNGSSGSFVAAAAAATITLGTPLNASPQTS